MRTIDEIQALDVELFVFIMGHHEVNLQET